MEMSQDLREKYYLIKFKILQKEYFTFWYTDDIDGFLLDTDGMLKSFPTKEEAIAFAEEHEFILDTKELVISSAILKRINTRKINCNLFLNHWNTFSDAAHSLNCPFTGDSREDIIRQIYEKLFYGCNILVKENEEHYRPKWSRKERRWIGKVMRNGFKILLEGLETDWHNN